MLKATINAWLLQEPTRAVVESALADRRFARCTIELHSGGAAAAIPHYGASATPQLIVLETDAGGDAILGQLDQLAEVCDAGTQVLLLGATNDIALYRELIRRGVADYLALPAPAGEIADALARIFIDPEAPPKGRVIGFMASRGGAGSSTIAHNVAWQLGQLYGEEVTLVDLDITYGTAALAFNIEPQQTIDQVLADTERLDDVLLDRFLLELDDNLRLLAAPARVTALEHNLTDPLEQLMDLLGQRSSFVVLDIPHRWAPWVKQVLTDADEAVITGVLDLAGLRDTRNLVAWLKQQRGEESVVRVVLNNEGAYRKTELSPKDFESALEQAPDLILPHDPALLGQAANNGQMAGQVSPRNRIVEAFTDLAVKVSGRQPVLVKRKSLPLNVEFLSRFKRSA